MPGENSNFIRLNLTRSDFNESLTCQITKKIDTFDPIGPSILAKTFIKMSMNPVITDILRLKEAHYEIEAESWPAPNFVRISAVPNCDNNCVIFKMVNGQYLMDTSPYLQEASFVEDIVVKEQVYGAKVRINLLLNRNQTKDIRQVYVGVGNDLNVATAKIDMLSDVPQNLTSDHASSSQSSLTLLIVTICVVLVLLVI